MAALYGTLMIMITDAATEHWNTQKAAFMRSAGICILFHKNQSPTVSASTIIRKDMMPCIERLVEVAPDCSVPAQRSGTAVSQRSWIR